MNRTQFCLVIIAVCISSMIGGGLTACVIHVGFVHALPKSKQPRRVKTFEELRGSLETEVVEEIKAESFSLVDETGDCKALFKTDENGYPFLVLYDSEIPRLLLEVHQDGPAIRLFDSDSATSGKETAALTVKDGEMAMLSFLQHEASKPYMSIGIKNNEIPFVSLGKKDNERISLAINDDMARMAFYYQEYKGFTIGVGDKEAGLIVGDTNTGAVLGKLGRSASISIYQDGKKKWSAP